MWGISKNCWPPRSSEEKIEDTGALTRKRMETIDADVLKVSLDWMDRTT